MNVKILRLNNEGEGIGTIDDKVIFVDNALPGEEVEVKITENHKNYLRGKNLQINSSSKNRIKPICKYYNECGGCDLMHMNNQIEFKKEKLENLFDKMCNEKINVNVFNFNDLYYRNKVTLKIKNNKLGFYKNKTNELVEINECVITNKKINEVIKNLNKYLEKNLVDDTKIMIRICNEEIMISIDKLKNIDNFIKEFNYLDSIYVDNKLVYGKESLIENIDEFNFYVSPKSFFQVNKEVMEKMYKKATSYIDKNELTLDLYSGTGTISILLSKVSKKVIGIEIVKDAVYDANKNLTLNNINNVEFICGKVEDKISDLKKLKVDNIVVDPPRAGINKKGLDVIKEISPEKIIYISCNPLTLARDYNYLKDNYELKEIKAFDMFPQTHHVETFCILKLKDY